MTTTQRRVQTNFTGGSGVPRRDVPWSPAPEQHERVEATSDLNAVPAGTAREVLGWVGNDKARAERALEAEQASGDPRKVLMATLLKVAGIKPVKAPEAPPVVVIREPTAAPVARGAAASTEVPSSPFIAEQPTVEP